MKTLYETIGFGGKTEEILINPPSADTIIRVGTKTLYSLFCGRRKNGCTAKDLHDIAVAIEILLVKHADYLEVVRTEGQEGHQKWIDAQADALLLDIACFENLSMQEVVDFNTSVIRGLDLRTEHAKDAFEASDEMEFGGLPKEMNHGWMTYSIRCDLNDTLSNVLARGSFLRLRNWIDKDHEGVESNAFQILWRNGSFKVGGAPAVASVRALSQKDRTRLNTEAKVEMSISLPYWLCATEKEREALIAHELRHLAVDYNEDTGEWKVKSNVPHNVQAFIEDLADTGVQDECQAMLVAAALQHPEIAKQLEHYEVLKGEQLDLFKQFADNLALSSMAVQEQERRELVAVPRGVSSVTFSSGDKSVTLTAKSGRQ